MQEYVPHRCIKASSAWTQERNREANFAIKGNIMNRLDFIEKESLRRDLPPFRVGDQVRVHVKVREGDKERIQVFEGLCLRRRGGSAGETFTVRKISNGVGVERIFPVQSPLVTKLEIMSRGFVRRSRLYYLRDLTGKKARLHSKVRDVSHLISPEEEERRMADAASDAPAKSKKKRGKKAKAARVAAKASE
jgi:large subunit ribosomal protein L19